ncbi:TonB-linked outer membrane protein, SusC/RagA family [Chitinophaga costaii]|uniref:TonB-linked outer membrane protein, SusC/RagA family n=1 Tax=Chitinophaga costaii TaxID=1335309 RepID=A0A1C4D2M2_9BACT|nr:TonB-dependent receptor [Chitinophaga costaii]PUZ24433.1 TonB-dependent receptor [Chitinophaga costaii]SCC25557.1 TonB-linked outer membrane protein, SusC/RagA family [Chitinophaga costaii]
MTTDKFLARPASLVLYFLLSIASASAQQVTQVSGTVTSEDGAPLDGVSIIFSEKHSKGTITDKDGTFRLSVPPGGRHIEFSLLGYAPQQLPITGAGPYNIHLKKGGEIGLDGVVVVGYAQQKRSTTAGVVSTINAVALKDIHGAGFNERLQGITPGLQISSNSGVEGGSALVRLRGATSINAGNDPLYIIDGVAISSTPLQTLGQGGQTTNPLADINPNDIQDVQVLKDANATAMYGSRAANGVIIITTKRGDRNGKTKVALNTEYGWGHYPKLWSLVTGPQHAAIINQAYLNDGGAPSGLPFPVTDTIGTYDRLHLIFRTAEQTTNNIEVSGGNGKTKFYLGGDFTNQQSILKLQDFQRMGFRVNIDHTLNKSLTIGVSTSYTYTKRSLSPNGDTGGILNTGLHTPTLTPIFKPDGSYNNGERFNNPYILFANNNDHAYGKHLIANGYVKWRILPNLSFRSSWSLDNNDYHEFVYYNANLTSGKSTSGRAIDANTSNVTWIGEQVFNYNVAFNSKHNLSVFAGNTLQKSTYQSASITGTNFPSISFSAISSAAIVTGSTTGDINAGLISYFAGANYSYDDKYIFDANLRTDASSRFGANNRWGRFPSLGAAWRIGEEKFIKQHLTWVDELKLKASLGWTGNQNIANFASEGLWSGGNNYQDNPGIAPSQLANPNLKWETTRQWDLGLQAGVLNNRLRFEFNYYDKQTSDLLLSVPIPAKTGFTSIYDNVGAVSNKGFEFEIASTNISNKNFQWTTTFNIAHNQNLVTKLPTAFTQYNRDWVKLQQGYSMYSFWLYKQLYVDPKTGNAVYQDVDHDGKITTADRQIVGNAFPKFFGGFSNSLSYKNFDLNFFLYFSQGNKVFNMNRYFQEHAGNRGTSWSMQASMLRAWKKEGDVTDIPRLTNKANPDGSFNHNFESSRFLEDASFIRLKNVALGYTLPARITNRVGIERLRAYVNVTNLFTITKYSGADPEVNVAQDYSNQTVQGLDFSMAPHPRTINIGLNVTF